MGKQDRAPQPIISTGDPITRNGQERLARWMGRVRAVHIGITGFTTLNEPTHFIAFAHAGRKRPRTDPTGFSYLWMRLDFTSNLGLLMRPTCWEPRPGILWLRPRTERIEVALCAHEVLWVPGVPRLVRICIPGTNYGWRFSADAIL